MGPGASCNAALGTSSSALFGERRATMNLLRVVGVTLIVLAVIAMTGIAASVDENTVVQRQTTSDLNRLASHGFFTRLAVGLEACVSTEPVPSEFVVICIGDREARILGGTLWSARVTPAEEQALLDLWVNRYLLQQQYARAGYGAARLATIVARDRFGAGINAPLAPMPHPLAVALRAQYPSNSGGAGVAFALFTMLFCWGLCRYLKSDGSDRFQ